MEKFDNIVSISPGRIPSVQIIFNKYPASPQIHLVQHALTPTTKRPRSAFFSYQPSKIPSFLPLNSSKLPKPDNWSRSISPMQSRPSSRFKRQDFNKQLFKAFIQETGSSFMTEHNAYNIQFENIHNEYKNADQQVDTSLNRNSDFCSQVKGFVHQSFPVRKVVSRKSKNKRIGVVCENYEEDETKGKSKCARSTSKVFKYTLKKRYHPVKYKLNYVPIRDKSTVQNVRK